jgi:hypothetical protein
MLDELKDIERELDRLKRRVRLSQLSNEELLSEVGSRTMPATDIAELLAAAEENARKKR